jgi:UDP-GlcNAc:undecaprenyl-phosphate GlcNAc-1-phosphate transferase
MRKGLNRRITAFTLWGLAGLFGAIATSIYIWPDTLGTQLTILGGITWVAMLIYFLRIPSEG